MAAQASSSTSTSTHATTETVAAAAVAKDEPISLIVLGMAGSGKTTFVKKLNEHLYENNKPPYVINLDPACRDTPYPPHIDIRDSINYKRVMKEYELGPNGAIITSLNLFATQFNQLVTLIEQRTADHKTFILDTPGQIEVFNWSASGMIITETLASQMPTAVVYIMDTVRNLNPTTFMSNMLYACSIMYKTKLPLIVVLNKSDVQNPEFINEWMRDFEKFNEALEGEDGYIYTYTRSLSLVLDEFYNDLKTSCVSSVTGFGMDEFLERVEEAKQEYNSVYKKEVESMKRHASQKLDGGDGKQRFNESKGNLNTIDENEETDDNDVENDDDE